MSQTTTARLFREHPAMMAELLRTRLLFQAATKAAVSAAAEMDRIARHFDIPSTPERPNVAESDA